MNQGKDFAHNGIIVHLTLINFSPLSFFTIHRYPNNVTSESRGITTHPKWWITECRLGWRIRLSLLQHVETDEQHERHSAVHPCCCLLAGAEKLLTAAGRSDCVQMLVVSKKISAQTWILNASDVRENHVCCREQNWLNHNRNATVSHTKQ